MLGGLGAAALAGLVNGLLIAKIRLSPFVTTLGTLSICRGVTYVITQGRGQAPAGPQVDTFYALTDGKLFGLPVALVYLLILAVIMGVALRHTPLGPLRLCARRQREGGAADRRARRPHQDLGLRALRAQRRLCGHPDHGLAGFGAGQSRDRL